MFIQFGPTVTYSGGEIDLFNQLSISYLQIDTKGLQKISFNKLSKIKLNFYHLPNLLCWTRDSMISLTQVAHKDSPFICFPAPWISPPKGINPLPIASSFGSPKFIYWSFEPHPKTLNLLVSKTLKVYVVNLLKNHTNKYLMCGAN